MYLIREILHCKPGKVRPMVDRFEVLSNALQELGHAPMRLLTDVSGEPFWTLVAEAEVARIDDFFEAERQLMADEGVRARMAGYHDDIHGGRREIFRIGR